jgi:hypothetical protein
VINTRRQGQENTENTMDQGWQNGQRGFLRLEVWLFLAMMALGLLGFMSTLSGGEVPEGEESGTPVPAQQLLKDR